MNISKHIYLLLFTVLPFSLMAQNKYDLESIVEKGDAYYKERQYKVASELYSDVIAKDSTMLDVRFKLAESYRNMFRYELAEPHYAAVYSGEYSKMPLSCYYLAITKKYLGKYEEAISLFDTFIADVDAKKLNSTENLALFKEESKIEKRGCLLAISQKNSPYRDFGFERLGEPVNSAYNDYSPSIFKNDFSIKVSTMRPSAKTKKVNPMTNEGFSDNYRFESSSNGKDWSQLDNTDGFDITNVNEIEDGAGVFTTDNTKFYYTSCQNEDGTCSIYLSELKGGKWSKPIKLNNNINLPGSDNKQPSLSSSGDTLYFVSTRKGGYGGNDIWMSVSSGQDKWGSAVNLGSEINTPKNDMSPFYYAKDKVLFFASDGHYGIGGLDIYMVKKTGSKVEINQIGAPFNSNLDDCYFYLGNKKGYLASNRTGGLGHFDIYIFNIEAKEAVIAQLKDNATSASRNMEIKNDSVFADANNFKEHTAKKEGEIFVDENGNPISTEALNAMTPEQKSAIRASTKKAKDALEASLMHTFYADANGGYDNATVTGRLLEIGTGKPAANVKIPMVDKDGKIVKETITNENGEFKYLNVKMKETYRILADVNSTSITSQPKYEVKDLKIIGNKQVSVEVVFENIYFDFNKFDLRKEAESTLDDIAAFCKANPNIQMELYAFTDAQGSDAYNLELSKKRGQATYNYLVSKGVDKTSIVINAVGNAQPLASNEDIHGRQLNRRVQFTVKGAQKGFQSPYATYVIKKQATLYSLAKEFGMTMDEVKKINRLDSDVIQAHRPIRVKKSSSKKESNTVYLIE